MTQERARPNARDASLEVTKALPAGNSTTVTSDAVDLGPLSARGARLEECELVLSVPELANTVLLTTGNLACSIIASAAADLSNPVTLGSTTIAGADPSVPASQLRCKPPTDCPRYVAAKVVSSAAAGNQATKSLTFGPRF